MKKWKQCSIIFIVMIESLCAISSLHANNIPLTLKDVLKIALQNNMLIQNAKNKYQIHALERHIDESYYFIPNVSLNLNHSNDILNNQDDKRHTYCTSLTGECEWNINKMLDNRWKRKIGRLSSHLHKLNIQVDIYKQVENLIHAFYDLAMIQKKKEITNKFLQIAKKTAQNITIKYKVGKTSKLDYLDAQATYYNRKEEVLVMDKDLKLKQYALNRLLSKDSYDEIKVIASPTLPSPLNTTTIIKSIKNNIKIAVKNKEIEKAHIALEEKKLALLPSFSLGIQKSMPLQLKYYHILNHDDEDIFTSSLQLGVNITWELRPLLLFSTELQKEKIKLNNATLDLHDEYLNVELSLQNKILEYTCLFTRHTTLTKILALKKEKLALNKARYQLGKITMLTLQQEEEKTKNIEIELITTTFAIKKLEDSLKHMIGELVY